ncbi:unnamed protein product [Triticum turgidum subsp. durum]|uniref:Uncharacterized protein n=1 Tax=Triticum turgidum subsp. durum TaxID=4567 RepID=A0A9R1BIM9_TRITD|nr:unnamed protein product [Triticum turgidum subsp. durum]
MEAVGVESKGSHGDAADPVSKKDHRTSWGCAFILVNNCFQSAAYFGLSTNLVNYLKVQLHSGSKAAANSVTNWQGTSGIAPLAADSFLRRYWTITLFLLVSVAGYGVVTASAWAALESAVFYAGLYLVGLGGALQPVMASFGADQFDVESDDDEERGRQSSFFNWFYLSLTRIAQVVVAAARKCDVETPTDAALLHERDGDDGMSAILGSRRLAHTNQFRFLDKAAVETAGDKARPASPWRLCTVTQVEELKCLLRLLPVWACGIIFAAAYTQVSTTFILQGDTLDPRIGSFRVPAAVLTVFDTPSVMLWVPLYDRAIVPLARRLTSHHRGFTQLTRMGVGFVILTVAMLTAGMLEVTRRRVLARNGTYSGMDGAAYVPLSIFWQVPRYVVLGAAEVGRWSSSTTKRQTPCGASARGSPVRLSRWATTRARRSCPSW